MIDLGVAIGRARRRGRRVVIISVGSGQSSLELHGSVSLEGRGRRPGAMEEAREHQDAGFHLSLQVDVPLLGTARGLQYVDQWEALRCGVSRKMRMCDLRTRHMRYRAEPSVALEWHPLANTTRPRYPGAHCWDAVMLGSRRLCQRHALVANRGGDGSAM